MKIRKHRNNKSFLITFQTHNVGRKARTSATQRVWDSSFHFLDASTYAYVDKENGTVTFCGHVHGLSPMNVAQIIKGIAGNPTAKRRINQILWREGAGTFLT